jgi:hypothetical protein
LKEFEMIPGDTLTDDQFQTIRTWLLNQGYGFGSGATSKFENPSARGKEFHWHMYHCETILTCPYLIGHRRDRLVNNDANAELSESLHHYLRLTAKSIIDSMLQAMDVLPVSE